MQNKIEDRTLVLDLYQITHNQNYTKLYVTVHVVLGARQTLTEWQTEPKSTERKPRKNLEPLKLFSNKPTAMPDVTCPFHI